jgi:CMP-N,N'-diacetyllegionaminic acid synthase
MNIVAIIPARGGSKGIPQKNIIDFCGKPLVAWSIDQANKSKEISSVWVTSDDNTILNTASEYGANIIKRPLDISSDHATSESAWCHAIDTITSSGEKIDLVIGIQTTSPIREPVDFDNAINLFLEQDLSSLFTSCEIEDHFIWEYQKQEMTSINHDWKNRKRRQEIKPRFLENGSFYIFSPSLIQQSKNRLGGKIGTYLMESYKKYQIDKIEDIVLCEILMKGYRLDKL